MLGLGRILGELLIQSAPPELKFVPRPDRAKSRRAALYGAGTNTLFFADGPNLENDGVFGMVNFDPPASDPPPTRLILQNKASAAKTVTMSAVPGTKSGDAFGSQSREVPSVSHTAAMDRY
jgi:hypothetical protein